MLITSLSNKMVLYACSLKEKKYRDKENKYLIEGEHLIVCYASDAEPEDHYKYEMDDDDNHDFFDNDYEHDFYFDNEYEQDLVNHH